MKLTPARLLRHEGGQYRPVRFATRWNETRSATIVRREVAVAEADAVRRLAQAEKKAAQIVAAAENQADAIRAQATVEGRASGLAQVAARAIEQRSEEAKSRREQLKRSVDFAVLLAERLLGDALQAEPARLATLVKTLLADVEGVFAVRVEAHPDDCTTLQGLLTELPVEPAAVTFEPTTQRKPGEPRLRTNVGLIDGDFGPQLARLSAELLRVLGEKAE